MISDLNETIEQLLVKKGAFDSEEFYQSKLEKGEADDNIK